MIPLKYRRKSSPPFSPRMLSQIAPFQSSFISPQINGSIVTILGSRIRSHYYCSYDTLTVLSCSSSRAPSLAPLNAEDAQVEIVSSQTEETFFRAPSSSRAPPSRYDNPHPPNQKSSKLQPVKTSPLRSLPSMRNHASGPPGRWSAAFPLRVRPDHPPPRRRRVVTPSLRNPVLPRNPSPPPPPSFSLTTSSVSDHGPFTRPRPRHREPSCRATSLLSASLLIC